LHPSAITASHRAKLCFGERTHLPNVSKGKTAYGKGFRQSTLAQSHDAKLI